MQALSYELSMNFTFFSQIFVPGKFKFSDSFVFQDIRNLPVNEIKSSIHFQFCLSLKGVSNASF